MAKVTRLQLDTLDKKLTSIVMDKMTEYKEDKPAKLTPDKKAELIQSGKVKIKKKIVPSAWDLYVTDVFDFSKYEQECNENSELIYKMQARLNKKKQDILDAYVLQGLDDIKELIKELEEFEVK